MGSAQRGKNVHIHIITSLAGGGHEGVFNVQDDVYFVLGGLGKGH